MPIYEYHCDCGKKKEMLLPMQEYNRPQTCVCGEVMLRKMSVPCVMGLDSSVRFTAEGKAAQGRDMALDSLNSKSSGFPSRKDALRDKGIWTAVAGLEKPPKTIF